MRLCRILWLFKEPSVVTLKVSAVVFGRVGEHDRYWIWKGMDKYAISRLTIL